MENHVRKQIKYLLFQEDMTATQLVNILSAKLEKKYTSDSFSHKLSRGSILYNEVFEIAKLLGYEIKFVKKDVD